MIVHSTTLFKQFLSISNGFYLCHVQCYRRHFQSYEVQLYALTYTILVQLKRTPDPDRVERQELNIEHNNSSRMSAKH